MAPIIKGESREIHTIPFPSQHLDELDQVDSLPIVLRRSERDHTSVLYGESYVLKTFRSLEPGVNPALEVGKLLSSPQHEWAATLAGYIEFHRRGVEPSTLAILQRFIPNQGTAWQFTLDQLSHFFERMAALSLEEPPQPPSSTPLMSRPEAGPAADQLARTLRQLPRQC